MQWLILCWPRRYYEVISPPYGEGLVGKKFPWAYSVTCRTDTGQEWCEGAQKRQAKRRKFPHGIQEAGTNEFQGLISKLFGRRRLALAPPQANLP